MKKFLLLYLLILSTLISFSQGQVNNRNNVEQGRQQKAAFQQRVALFNANKRDRDLNATAVDTPTNVYLAFYRYKRAKMDSLRSARKDFEKLILKHPDSTQSSRMKTFLNDYNNLELENEADVNWYQHQYDTFVYARGDFRWWLPTTTRAMKAATFTNYAKSQSDFNVINQVQFQAQQGTASLYAELLGTNIGHFRVSFGSLIAANNDSSVQQQTLQSFLAGGGNAVLNGYYPLIYVRSDFFTLLWEYSPKIGGQIPGMGTYNNNVTGNAQLIASDIYMDFSSFDNTLGIYGFLRGAYTFGSNDFYDNLQIPRHMFGYLQLNAGMVINQNVRISVSGPIASTTGSLLRAPWQIGVQLMPVSAKK